MSLAAGEAKHFDSNDLPAGAATSITAQQLEVGASHFEGRFGDGSGKWRLFVEAD